MFAACQESDKYSTVKTAIYLNVWLKHATIVWCTLASWLADLLVSTLTSRNHHRTNKHDWWCAIRSHQVIINPFPPFQMLRNLWCSFCDVTNMVFQFLDTARRNSTLHASQCEHTLHSNYLSAGYGGMPFGTRSKFFMYLLYSPMIVVPVSPQADTCLRPASCRTSPWVWFSWQARWQSSAPVCCF